MADMEMAHGMGMTPFESFIMTDKTSRRASGTAIAGLVLGSVGAAAAIGAWVFGPVIANTKANGIRDLANAQFAANNQQIATLTSLLSTERAERVAGDINLTNTVSDTVSGSQQGSLTAQQMAELSSIQTVENNLLNQAIMGNLSQAPQKVAIWRDATACGCPGCGN